MTETTDTEKLLFTQTEITGQPDLWKNVYSLLRSREDEIASFLHPIFRKKGLQILLTGAGSSAFVGEAAQGLVQINTGCSTRAVATTDLVTHPELYFRPEAPSLLVSFARSGNSPESVESIRLADAFCEEVYHLVITCNREGELHRYASSNKANSFSILLPEAANDKSLAMTGSFTSMLLSILLAGRLDSLSTKEDEITRITEQGAAILQEKDSFKKIAALDLERVVFLGSGPLLGIARECHLKLQELTDGKVVCKHDSFLGFRHGPRAVVNDKTLMVYLFSENDFVYKYEKDLALSIAKDPRKIPVVSIGKKKLSELQPLLNIDLEFSPTQELNSVPVTLAGQLLGFYKSLELGLNPDNPSVSGSISRVVQGVNIYEHPKKKK